MIQPAHFGIRGLGLSLLVVVLATMAGCAFKGEPAAQTDPADEVGDQVWRIVPTSLRVFPTTRLVKQEDGQWLVQAWIEVLDEFGDPMKASADFAFELFLASPIDDQPGPRLFTWNRSLTDPASNQEHYDPVTRAYLFQLRMEQLPTGTQRVQLQVRAQQVEGPRLTARTTLVLP